MKNPGIIYEDNDGRFCVGYYKDQTQPAQKADKILLRYYDDRKCTKRMIKDGKGFNGIKHVSKLKIIGYTD